MIDLEVIHRVQQTLLERKGAAPDSSYVASLYAKGTEAICKKVAEEGAEVIMAAKDGDRLHLVREVCDLWFHSLIVLARHGPLPTGLGRRVAGGAPELAGPGERALRADDMRLADNLRQALRPQPVSKRSIPRFVETGCSKQISHVPQPPITVVSVCPLRSIVMRQARTLDDRICGS